MTLRELQRRVNQLVAENDQRWPERNELPVLIEERRATKRHLTRHLPVEFAKGGMYTIGSRSFSCTLTTNEKEEVKL